MRRKRRRTHRLTGRNRRSACSLRDAISASQPFVFAQMAQMYSHPTGEKFSRNFYACSRGFARLVLTSARLIREPKTTPAWLLSSTPATWRRRSSRIRSEVWCSRVERLISVRRWGRLSASCSMPSSAPAR